MASEVSVVHSDPEILGGPPVFVGTFVPLRNLIDYLERLRCWKSRSPHSLRKQLLRDSKRYPGG